MNALIETSAPATMTSREIADLVESRHDKVKQSIERLAARSVISLPPVGEYLDSLGRAASEYRVGKRDSFVVVAQLSPEFTARLVDRWQELEARATPVKPKPPLNQTIQAAKLFPPFFRIARLIGCDKPTAAISANQAVREITGENVLEMLGQTHMLAENQVSMYFTPTELGKRIGTSARGMNLLLAEAGLQMKRNNDWEITDAGKDFSRIYDTGKRHGSGVPVQQIKWSAEVLPVLGRGADAA